MPTPGQIQAFSDLASEFASVDTGKRDRFLDRASARTSTSLYPAASIRDEAVALLAAHMLSGGAGSGSSSGTVTEERVGPLTVRYAEGSGGDGLGSTSYGRQLMELVKSYSFGPTTQIDTTFGDEGDL